MSNEAARGRAKNARNQLKGMLRRTRKDEQIPEESIEYTLQEVKAALDEME